MKKIIIMGIVASIPLVLATQMFFYLSSVDWITRDTLYYIKNCLYFLFILTSIGTPVYFYIKKLQLKILSLIALILISWGVFSISMTFTAFFVYHGLRKDIDETADNMAVFFLKWFLLGIIFQLLPSVLTALSCRWYLLKSHKFGKLG